LDNIAQSHKESNEAKGGVKHPSIVCNANPSKILTAYLSKVVFFT